MNLTCGVQMKPGFAIGYNKDLAVARDSIDLGEGTHYLLARNGRGKTTLLRTLAGVLSARAEGASLLGRGQFVAEDIYYNDHLSAGVILKALLPAAKVKECLDFADKIELDVKKAYRALSTGNKRKVSWLMAEFSCDDEQGNVLLLDEPFTGVDSFVREAFMEYWEAHEQGVCRLVSCHPDFDSMNIKSAVLISEGKLSLENSEGMRSWGQLKTQLV